MTTFNDDNLSESTLTYLPERDTPFPSYLSDRPVGTVNDSLWGEGSIIRKQIRGISQRIVSPLSTVSSKLSEQGSDSMTFAIYGHWGMGKSSALRMLKEEVLQLAEKNPTIDVGQIKVCEYIASAYQSFESDAQIGLDARVTLAQRIFTTLAGEEGEALQQFLGEAIAIGANVLPDGVDPRRSSGSNYILTQVVKALIKLMDFDSVIRKRMQSPDGKSYVLLVLIDDLDRCTTNFVWQILNFIQQLSEVPNLFFVLAVEQEHLKNTVKKHSLHNAETPTDPDFALEKYVQHTISVPDMSETGLQVYVEKLLGDSPNSLDYTGVVGNVIIKNVQFLDDGLRAASGERRLTPRSVKRCLNTISLDLQERFKLATTPTEQQKVLKQRILEFVWFPFYQHYFFPIVMRDKRKNMGRMFEDLEEACAAFKLNENGAMLRFNLESISTRYKFWDTELDLVKDVTHSLARYLGNAPFWFYKPAGEKLEEDEPEQVEAEQFAQAGMSFEDRFQNYYIHSETGEATGNRIESLTAANQMLTLILSNRDHFNKRHAPQVGNIAINAERFGVADLAEKLYELALDLDPDHSHNIQNYVDFIVKQKVTHLYPRARDLIRELKSPKHAKYRLDRTLALEAQLNNEEPESGDGDRIDPEEVKRIVNTFLQDPSSRQRYVSVMSLLDAVQDFETMRIVARASYSVTTNENDRYITLRGLADTLAAAPEERNEKEAMDIYRYMREHFTSIRSRPEYPDMLHNYATLLYKHDYDDEAGRMWFEAYKDKPGSMGIRRAYGLYLLRAEQPELARLVTEGQPVLEMKLQPTIKPLPERFLDEEIERWWEFETPPTEGAHTTAMKNSEG